MRERFGARDPRALALRFHAQTAGSTLTAQQPENNIVRVAVQALAAVLGGCQSLHTNSMDEALALPTEAAVRIALRTQQILAHESGVAATCDPLGGAVRGRAPHAATSRTRPTAYLDKIDGMGGAVAAIPFMQREIQDAAYRYQQEVETRARVVVGVNEFVTDATAPVALFRPDPAVEARQAERLAGSPAAPRPGPGGPRARRRGAGGARHRQPAPALPRRRASRRHPGGALHAPPRGVRRPSRIGRILTPRRSWRRMAAIGRRGSIVLLILATATGPVRADVLQDLGTTYQKVAEELAAAFPKVEVQVAAAGPDGVRLEGPGVERLRPGLELDHLPAG